MAKDVLNQRSLDQTSEKLFNNVIKDTPKKHIIRVRFSERICLVSILAFINTLIICLLPNHQTFVNEYIKSFSGMVPEWQILFLVFAVIFFMRFAFLYFISLLVLSDAMIKQFIVFIEKLI